MRIRVHHAPRCPACCTVLLAMTLLARALPAQAVGSPGRVAMDSVCSYRTCALTIAPRWNGLAVVSGDARSLRANLHFLVPRDITAALAGPPAGMIGADSAATYARHAVRLRRTGAALTDAGLLIGAVAALHALRSPDHPRRDARVGELGGAFLLLSIPFQFAADEALSRAVWWHNLRYAR